MASKLDAALAWAARGFRVFPLVANEKLPLDQGWTTFATTDPDVIRGWWLRVDPVVGTVVEQDYNIGCLTSDLVVVDVDTKAGKPGLETFFDLGLDFDTLTVCTPTGGYHVYLKNIGRQVGNAPLGSGLDVRSYHGFVVAPGSTIDGVPYAVDVDLPVAEVPHAVRPLLRAPRARRGGAGVSVELDQPESLEMAAHWLRREAPAAIQGQNGDDTTYKVCCRLRDYGVSEEAALDLLLDVWNQRCEPPWDAAELRRKLENAWQYATGEAGSASPEALFGDVVDVPLPFDRARRDTIKLEAPAEGLLPLKRMMREEEIEERDWVVPNLLLRQHMTLVAAPGGAGKSLVSLIIAAHLAVGRSIWGYEVRVPGHSVVYNAEDDRAEVSRRLHAICDAFELDKDVVSSSVEILCGEDFDLQVTKGTNPPTIRQEHVDALAHALAKPEIVFASIDPLIEVHTGKESDNVEMRYVMSVLRSIARFARVALMVVQHTPKSSGKETRSGDMDAARGATSIGTSCRVGLTMFPASDAEALEIGTTRAKRKSFVKIEGAKVSYGQGREGPLWLRWESRSIASGDSVGVLVEHDAKDARLAETARVAKILGPWLLEKGGATATIKEASMHLALSEPDISPDDLGKKVKRLFATPVQFDGGAQRLVVQTLGGKGACLVLG